MYNAKKYGNLGYGGFSIGLPVVNNLRIVRAFEGPQILIYFNAPDIAWNRIIVKRKVKSFPENSDDGITIFEDDSAVLGKSFKISDRDLAAKDIYYYTIFTHREEVGEMIEFFDYTTQGKTSAIETGFFEHYLWNNSPNIYKLLDRIGL